MKVKLLVPPTPEYTPWGWIQPLSPTRPHHQSLPWSPASQNKLKHHQLETQGAGFDRQSKRPRQIKRDRLALNSETSNRNAQEPLFETPFDLPADYRLPEIRLSYEAPASRNTTTRADLGIGSGGYVNAALKIHLDNAQPPPYLDREDPESISPPVSPLETPSDYLQRFNPDGDVVVIDIDMDLDPFGDVKLSCQEERRRRNVEVITNADVQLDQSAPETCYTLERYLAGEDIAQPQTPSPISCSILGSPIDGASIDITSQLRMFDSDISDALAGMRLCNDDYEAPSMRSDDPKLVAKQGEEDPNGGIIAEGETENPRFEDENSIFTVDRDETVVLQPRSISQELEAWISKSSLIVGQFLKPLEGSVDSTGSPFVENRPRSRKRKASVHTCQ